MMKITVRELYEMYEAIQALAPKGMPVAGAFKVARLARQLRPEYTLYEQQRGALVVQYGHPVAGQPGSYHIPRERLAEFQADLEALMSLEIELPLQALNLNDFADLQIAPAVLLGLGDLLVENPL